MYEQHPRHKNHFYCLMLFLVIRSNMCIGMHLLPDAPLLSSHIPSLQYLFLNICMNTPTNVKQCNSAHAYKNPPQNFECFGSTLPVGFLVIVLRPSALSWIVLKSWHPPQESHCMWESF
jgi:hypothetical protein